MKEEAAAEGSLKVTGNAYSEACRLRLPVQVSILSGLYPPPASDIQGCLSKALNIFLEEASCVVLSSEIEGCRS